MDLAESFDVGEEGVENDARVDTRNLRRAIVGATSAQAKAGDERQWEQRGSRLQLERTRWSEQNPGVFPTPWEELSTLEEARTVGAGAEARRERNQGDDVGVGSGG